LVIEQPAYREVLLRIALEHKQHALHS
jgi:hypothetical protein